ncbi:MAG TPA: CCA tRNA nucleotidyltransferase [Planctomycetota bacterium]|nr:CCA tRNA nucleotidyltransferase [Planctomycetota bacterium]
MPVSNLRETAIGVLKRLRQAGFESYFAGGCVRDRLLGKDPQDYDIATRAPPEEVERLFGKTVLVGKAFGVVKVLVDGVEVEVATFRAEGPYGDGRHPDWVKFSSAKEDVLRRDFTVNGMLEDPVAGQILDFVGGQADLKVGILRSIGDPAARFEEDKLRMLRAVRFEAQLGFAIEPETFDAVRALAPKLALVSRERVRDELRKILAGGRRASGLRRLIESGLMTQILPEITAMAGVPQPKEWHPEGDVLVHTLLAMEKLEAPSFEVAMGTLLHDVGKPPTLQMDGERPRFNQHERIGAEMAERICQRLRLSNEETQTVVYIVAGHMKFKDVAQMRDSTLRRFLSEPHFAALKEAHRADVLASNGDLSALEFIKKKSVEFEKEGLRPEPLLRGRDLLGLGLKPGPHFAEILQAVEDLQLEGRLRTREEAIEHARKTWPGHF